MIARLQAAIPRAAALGLLVALAGCAPANVVPLPATRPGVAPGADAGAPRAAWFMPGRVLIAYERPGGDVFLEATWPAATGPAHAVAQLDLADGAPRVGADPAMRPVRLHGRADWDALLSEVFISLAPADPGQATLVVVQGVDIVFHRDDAGTLRTYRHERKPARLAVVRTLDDREFARVATALLASRWGADEPRLFAAGDPEAGAGYVLFEPAAGQSVLIAPVAAPDPAAGLGAVGISLDFAQALVLQSHVLAPLTRPFASTERLLTQAAQSAIAAMPQPVGGTVPPAPLAEGPPMDRAAWERELDSLVDSPRMPGRIQLLIDGDAFFTRFVQSVQDARESIDIRVYIFDRDAFALRIADLLKARSREIRVRVLVDELGSIGACADASRTPRPQAGSAIPPPVSLAAYLREGSSVDVRAVPNPFLTSDHTKVLLFDGERAFVGGMNIGYQYRYLWHDLMVEVEGPIAARLARDFEAAFRRGDILPTRGDSGFMNSANLIATRMFVQNGVRVYAYPGMTHAKAALYDGWAIVGSANFDKLSLRVNGETCLATSDPGFVASLRRELFERDLARSAEIATPPAVGWTTYVADFVADQL